MVHHINSSQQKLAEKLTILNDRGQGMLARVYNMKKANGDPKFKPSILSDKALEGPIKQIVRRFPNLDTRGNTNLTNAVGNARTEIMKSTSIYYYTFVDLLDFKDHVCDLLTTMDALQLQLDIHVNFDLTKYYLDLISTYVALMVLISRVEDRKAILGLFNTAYELIHGHSDNSFPRLGQMVVDYENPMRRLAEEFVPHAKLLFQALVSLQKTFHMRNLSAEEWRKSQILSITADAAAILDPAQTDAIQCEYLSLDTMERYIIFGFLLIHQCLSQSIASSLFTKALQCGWVTTLFRDEVVHTHGFVQQFFEGIKGSSKNISLVKENYNHVLQNARNVHREKRKFLRSALKELGLIISDQPGLIGPKVLLVFMSLSFARDEVLWLLRHYDNIPVRQSRPKTQNEDLIDRQLPELLFHIEELRSLVCKYNQVIQSYYIQYLTNCDAPALNQIIQKVAMMPEEDSIILESIYTQISNLSLEQVSANMKFDFRGLRLDWFRLQAYMSVNRYPIHFFEERELPILMNTIVFHTKMMDFSDQLLIETSDLSAFCFYNRFLDEQFRLCLEFPAQTRYIIAFPLICGHFMNCCHELCPEERYQIGERSINLVNIFLEEMSKEATNLVTCICEVQFLLSDQLLPKHAVLQIASAVRQRKSDKEKNDHELNKPGVESYRRSREDLTKIDKLHIALTELCFAINYCSVHAWEHTFNPREYLFQHLESQFNKTLVHMVMYNASTLEIAKPSELLTSVRAYMHVLQSIENFVNIDISRIFNHVLLQQTQPQDSNGAKTITSIYSNWYLEVLLRRVSTGDIVYSPIQKAFVTLPIEGQVPFCAEEYSDVTELRSLAELIGPYGMMYCNESLMWHIASQVTELKKLVISNKDTLATLRMSFDKPDLMKDLFKKLQNVDSVLQRMTIIGVILCFRSLAQEALHDVLSKRIPFLLSSITDFTSQSLNDNSLMENVKAQVISEMSSACGLQNKVDPLLVAALRSQKSELGEEEYIIACLMMVFVAVSLPKLARNENSVYRQSLDAHTNNIHCLAQAINGLVGSLFTIYNHGDIEDRLKEFLALASSSLLRLGVEQDKEAIRNRESVYLLLEMIVRESPFLTMDLLESCFPYALLRNAYRVVLKSDGQN